MSNPWVLGSLQLSGYYPVEEWLQMIVVIKELLWTQVFSLLKKHDLWFERQESFIKDASNEFKFPEFFLRELWNSRIVAYAKWKDKWIQDRIVIVFYDADDKLCYIEVQRWVPSQKIVLAPEWLWDDVIIDWLLGNWFVRVQPAWAFVPDDWL